MGNSDPFCWKGDNVDISEWATKTTCPMCGKTVWAHNSGKKMLMGRGGGRHVCNTKKTGWAPSST